MAHCVSRFDALPAEVFTAVTAFLTGPDLLSFSHVNSALLAELLAPNCDVWVQRLSAKEAIDVASAKRWYCKRRPVCFLGSVQGLIERGGAIAIPTTVSRVCERSSFTISLWFAIKPPSTDEPDESNGGILLGGQSSQWSDPNWPHYHQQFIHIDPHNNLYCTVTDNKEIVENNLEPGRWNHLVLTYARSLAAGRPTQLVYLNGEQVHASSRPLHYAWVDVENWQLGSGCISGPEVGKPTRNFCAWYGFRGWIDDFCVRDRVLSIREIQKLSSGDRIRNDGIVWSERQALAAGTAQLVGTATQAGYVRPNNTSGRDTGRDTRKTARRGRIRRFFDRFRGGSIKLH